MGWAARRLLSSLEPSTRLRLRADPRYVRLANAIHLAHAFNRTRDLASDLDLALVRAFAPDLDLDRDRARDRDRDRALNRAARVYNRDLLDRDLVHDLARALDRALDLARALVHDRNLVRDLAHDLGFILEPIIDLNLKTVLNHTTVLDTGYDLALDLICAFVQTFDLDLDLTNVASPGPDDLSRLLTVLENVAVDFTHADLRAVSLVGVPLEGIRWSSATRWPPDWEEKIRAESIETDDGTFVIRGGGRRSAPVTV